MHDHLTSLFTYKTMHALCAVTKQKDEDGKPKMRAVYYVSCLIYGKAPLWAIWRVSDGRRIGWATSRDEIEELHPNLSWRKVMARWHLVDDRNADVHKRRLDLQVESGGPLPTSHAWNPSMVKA